MVSSILLLAICCLGCSFVISAIATPLVIRNASRWGLIDKPNAARKVHTVPTPLGGGLAIWLGIVGSLFLAQVAIWIAAAQPDLLTFLPGNLSRHIPGALTRSQQLWAIVFGATILAALGLVDDLRNLTWQPKLVVQFAVAIAVVAGGVRGTLFVTAPWVGWTLTVLWIVVLTNSFNFLDNMDGLAGGMALIVSLVFALIMLTGTSEPHWFVAAFLFVLAGSILGFLVYNWPPAKIFMGDTGSCPIGFLLACLTVVGTFYEYNKVSRHVVFAPLCVLAVPLYDFCSVILIRLKHGRSPFHADKSHFSHRLVELGLSRKYAVLTIHLVTLATGLAGAVLFSVQGWIGAVLVAALVACMLSVIAILETAGRRAARARSADEA